MSRSLLPYPHVSDKLLLKLLLQPFLSINIQMDIKTDIKKKGDAVDKQYFIFQLMCLMHQYKQKWIPLS